MSALIWRASQAVVVTVLVGVLSFAMMMALPGDMLFRIAGARFGYDNINAENVELVRAQVGDPSGPAAFMAWLADLSTGNLGQSLVTGQTVWAEISHQLGATAQLAGVAVILSLLIGPPLGVWAGLHPGSRIDKATLILAALFKSTPQFLLGLGLIVVVSVGLGLLPAAGYGNAEHFILPALTLASCSWPTPRELLGRLSYRHETQTGGNLRAGRGLMNIR
nr:ABC transporter permease [Veronia nyctiphanis]